MILHFLLLLSSASIHAFVLPAVTQLNGLERRTALSYHNVWRVYNGLKFSFISHDGNFFSFEMTRVCACGEHNTDVFAGPFMTVKRIGKINSGIAKATGTLTQLHFIGRIVLNYASGQDTTGAADIIYFVPLPEMLMEIGQYANTFHSLCYTNLDMEEQFDSKKLMIRPIPPQDPSHSQPAEVETAAAVVNAKFEATLTVHVIAESALATAYVDAGLSEELSTLAVEHLQAIEAILTNTEFGQYRVKKISLARKAEIFTTCESDPFCQDDMRLFEKDEMFDEEKASLAILELLTELAREKSRRASFVLLLTYRDFKKQYGRAYMSTIGECGTGLNVGFVNFKNITTNKLFDPAVTINVAAHEANHIMGSSHDDPEYNAPECTRNFLMHPYALPHTERPNNQGSQQPAAEEEEEQNIFQLSTCSKANISRNLKRKHRYAGMDAMCINFTRILDQKGKQKRLARQLSWPNEHQENYQQLPSEAAENAEEQFEEFGRYNEARSGSSQNRLAYDPVGSMLAPSMLAPATYSSNNCAQSQYGCCPDGETPVNGPDMESCSCQYTRWGCCDDGEITALGPLGEGCNDCRYTKHGCCPDGHNRAFGPNFAGCLTGGSVLPSTNGQGCLCNANNYASWKECQYSCAQTGISQAHPQNDPLPAPHAMMPLAPQQQPQLAAVMSVPEESFNAIRRQLFDVPAFEEDNPCQHTTVNSGNCQNHLNYWYFDPFSGRCHWSIYSGCDSNRNRFSSEMECILRCVHLSKSGSQLHRRLASSSRCRTRRRPTGRNSVGYLIHSKFAFFYLCRY